MQALQVKKYPGSVSLVLRAVALAPLLGLGFLGALLLLGFESISTAGLAVTAGAFVLPALVTAFHLLFTRTLSAEQKAAWRGILLSRRTAARGVLSYLVAADRTVPVLRF